MIYQIYEENEVLVLVLPRSGHRITCQTTESDFYQRKYNWRIYANGTRIDIPELQVQVPEPFSPKKPENLGLIFYMHWLWAILSQHQIPNHVTLYQEVCDWHHNEYNELPQDLGN